MCLPATAWDIDQGESGPCGHCLTPSREVKKVTASKMARGSVMHKESQGAVITKHSLITIDAGMQSCSGKTRIQITLELKGEAEELDSQGEDI